MVALLEKEGRLFLYLDDHSEFCDITYRLEQDIDQLCSGRQIYQMIVSEEFSDYVTAWPPPPEIRKAETAKSLVAMTKAATNNCKVIFDENVLDRLK
ncbi:hypothetical protein FACS189449_09850 [Alphaproteobacteria bacterium]|nr:hypothetical protein FACS189449_09850 [Alphaproteobacteria bacterium]